MNVVRELCIACYVTTNYSVYENTTRSLLPSIPSMQGAADNFRIHWSDHTSLYFDKHGFVDASGGSRVVTGSRLAKHYWGEG